MSATYQQGLLTLQRKRTGGNQHVTVNHIHQQVNVTEGGQAVVAGDKVTSRTRGKMEARQRSTPGYLVAAGIPSSRQFIVEYTCCSISSRSSAVRCWTRFHRSAII